jgi:hypothetical protein
MLKEKKMASNKQKIEQLFEAAQSVVSESRFPLPRKDQKRNKFIEMAGRLNESLDSFNIGDRVKISSEGKILWDGNVYEIAGDLALLIGYPSGDRRSYEGFFLEFNLSHAGEALKYQPDRIEIDYQQDAIHIELDDPESWRPWIVKPEVSSDDMQAVLNAAKAGDWAKVSGYVDGTQQEKEKGTNDRRDRRRRRDVRESSASKYDDHDELRDVWREVASDLEEAGHDPNELTIDEIFDKWCDYEGLIGYGPKLRKIIRMLDRMRG